MHRYSYALVILVITVTASLAAEALWEKAVGFYETYGDLTPGRVEVEFSQYNGKEELISNEESLYRIAVTEAGELESLLVYARKDGEDVTEERRDDPGGGTPFGGGPRGESEGGGAFAGLGKSPFDPQEQSNVDVTSTRDVTSIRASRARRYDFVHDTGADSASVGSAWLDVETGMPLRVQVGLEEPPGFVDSFRMVQEFALDDDDRWVGTSLRFSGAGRILFFRRRIESYIEFSDYFPYERLE